MTRPRFFVAPGSIVEIGAFMTLTGPEGRHAATVMRIGVGESILLSDSASVTAVAEVIGVVPGELRLCVTQRGVPAQRTPRLMLVQALAKGDRDEIAVEAATELGVDGVIPWQADRSISVWKGHKVDRGVEKWRSLVLAAAKQSRREFVPDVFALVTTKQLVNFVLERTAAGAQVLVLHEADVHTLANIPLITADELIIVVGPEGGISDDEVAAFCGAGAQSVRLGPEVLRTSTAGPAALAVVSHRLGRWE